MAASFTDEQYTELENAAYEAAVIPELWPKVFSRLGELTDTVGGSFCTITERGVHIVNAPEMDNIARRIIAEGYMEKSGRAAGVIKKGLVGVPRFLNEFDYYDTLEDAERDAIVTEVFRQDGMGWAAGWLLTVPHGDTLIMNVEQWYEKGPIAGEALERLDSVYSIFARAAVLSARSGFSRVQTAIETLTGLGLPAAAVTPAGKVVLANGAFDAATHLWGTRGGDRLALNDVTADQMLTTALEALREVRSPRSIPIRSTLGGVLVAVLQLVPIRRQAHDVFGSADAILVLSEPKTAALDPTLVQSLFDLTPAELSVAQAIAAGQSVTEIARAARRSPATIRNQLSSVMTKTGTSRQVELAILIRQLNGMLPMGSGGGGD
jgi:DNA-binding CsgD family transcriptional regulator